MDLDRVEKLVANLPDVTLALQENFPCSPAGKEVIKKAITDNNLTHCVFASCSHREHEKTFSRIIEDAGLNPYMMEMANIREHCAWVIDDLEQATERAIFQIKSAVAMVRHNQPLTPQEIEVNTAVAVIGGGIAGIKAAKLAARDGRKVYLIEKEASVGGKMPRWEKSYPSMDCNPCFLAPEISELKEIENIEIIDSAKITEVVGFFGSFTIKLIQEARSVSDDCMSCGECGKACPVEIDNPFNYGLDKRAAIYVPFPGSLPSSAKVDKSVCLRFNGEECDKCVPACMFGAVDFSQEDQTRELAVGAIILATGFTTDDIGILSKNGGMIPNVITSPQLERLLSSTGPTAGHLKLANGDEPKSVTIVNCAGREEYCSRVCCAVSLKYAKFLTEHYPDMTVNLVHHDLCLAGEGYQRFYTEIKSSDKINFLRMNDYQKIAVSAEGDSRSVKFSDMNDAAQQVSADMVVLSVGMQPSVGMAGLLDSMSVEADADGFPVKNHAKMDPVMTGIEGVYIAGCAGGPKDEQESVISAEASAGQATSRLIAGQKIKLEVITSYVDEDACSGCRACISVCPYKAISADEEKKIAVVSEILCKGCGTCVAACPSGAMRNHHFETAALNDALTALLAN